MNTKLKKKLRTIGHELNPVVTIAGNGLSEGVLAELERALEDHELIKVKIAGSREEREVIINDLEQIDEVQLVQKIGGIALIYRPAREPNPSLSNILRANVL